MRTVKRIAKWAWDISGIAFRIQKIYSLFGTWHSVSDWSRNLLSPVISAAFIIWGRLRGIPLPLLVFMGIAICYMIVLGWEKVAALSRTNVAPVTPFADIPRIVPIKYGKAPSGEILYREGLYLGSDNDHSSYDITIGCFKIGKWNVRFLGADRINKEQVFCGADISRGHQGTTSLDAAWNDSDRPESINFVITYRDSSNQWFQSNCVIDRDIMAPLSFSVRLVNLEAIVKP